jgi:hypothetical protein
MPHAEQMNQEMLDCIQKCLDCHRVCVERPLIACSWTASMPSTVTSGCSSTVHRYARPVLISCSAFHLITGVPVRCVHRFAMNAPLVARTQMQPTLP